MDVFKELLVVDMRSASYPTLKKVLIDSAVFTSLGVRTQRLSSFPITPSFRSLLKKWSWGKTDLQDQTDWSTYYVLQKVHVLLL